MKGSFQDKIQSILTPLAVKIGNKPMLLTIRDSFLGVFPVIMTGSIVVLVTALLTDFPSQFGITWPFETFKWLIDINTLIYRGTISVISLAFVVSLGMNIAKMYKQDLLSSSIIALSGFIIALGNSIIQNFTVSQEQYHIVAPILKQIEGINVTKDGFSIEVNNLISQSQIGASGYFAAMIIGFLSSWIYCKLMNKNLKIKLPSSVPPSVAKPFESIIPGFGALFVIGVLTWGFQAITNNNIIDWMYSALQLPLLGLSQNYFAVLVVIILNVGFGFFGLHGGALLSPIMEGLFGVAMIANLEAYQSGQELPYIWNSGSFGSFVWYGSVGCCIALFVYAKSANYKELAKLAAGPLVFNIGEPMQFGLPVVLNITYLIPSFLCPIVMSAIAYCATYFGLMDPVSQNVTWVMPPILYGFFATAFDWRAIVVSIINIFVAFLIYTPFVKIADKQLLQESEINSDK
ncbi:PTS sugar transporter subunit IIC [Enterococcus faecalis]|nr:PTS sugar transporter subunit IIC [Enterococcus faecalis]